MIESIQTFLAELHQVTSFEEAADRVLARAMELTARAAPQTGMRVLRGIVHLRPRDVYEGIRIRDVDASLAAGRGATRTVAPLAPSTTAWRWVKHRRDTVVLDVAQAVAYDVRGALVRSDSVGWSADFRSREAILERRACHIAAMPLRRPGGRVDGFVSIELTPESAGANVAREALCSLGTTLQTLVDVAASFLCELPRESPIAWPVDDRLPVVGATMRPRIELLRQLAVADDPLLLLGESGVGKSQLARWCHEQSPRAREPFVKCTSLTGMPADMRAGELFGWVPGAFTGATNPRKGRVAEAEGGTLFIDEVDKLPLQAQAMLLELLDTGTYHVLGKAGEQEASVRFMVASNADLHAAVDKGYFLPDLYYRIVSLPMNIPPLRERRDEIADWARHMLGTQHRKNNRAAGEVRLEPAAGALLERQHWPGNLRELEHVIKRAYILASGQAPDGVCVRAAHVQQALDWGAEARTPASQSRHESALWRALEQAATVYVQLARQREGGLSLDHADALVGLVLNEALGQLDDIAAVVRMLGREKYLDGDNQYKLFRTHWQRVTRLAEELGVAAPESRLPSRSRARRHKK